MENQTFNFFSSRSLIIVTVLTIIVWLFGLSNRYIEADEYVLGEYSYSFLKSGVVKLKTIPEILDWNERVFGHHRFFTWYGAIIINFFGWSIIALKTSLLPFYSLFFFFLYKFFKLENLHNKHFYIAALLVVTSPILILKSFSFRPDLILMTEGIAGLYFLRRYRLEHKWIFALGAGIAAGLAFLTHLNGMTFCIAGFLFLIFTKEFKALIPYIGAGALVGGMYFIELLPPGNFEKFIYEITHWPTVNHGENYIGGGVWGVFEGRIIKLLSEHKRFFWGYKVIGFSAVFLLTMSLNFKYLIKNFRDVMLYLLLLILSLNLFGSHIAERYILFYYGPMFIITAISMHRMIESSQSWKMAIVGLAFIVQFAFAGKMFLNIYERSYDAPAEHKAVLSIIPNEDKPPILVPYEMVFNEFPNYNLFTYKTYEYLQEGMTEKFTAKTLLEKANSLGMKYVIINERMANDKSMWFENWNIDTTIYEILFRDKDYLILVNKSPQP